MADDHVASLPPADGAAREGAFQQRRTERATRGRSLTVVVRSGRLRMAAQTIIVPRALRQQSSWQLVASNFVSTSITGMAPNIIAPRPDSERGTHSRYSWAYPGIRYEIPISVQGGSYPFRYTITGTSGTATNLASATIGGTLDIVGDHQERGANYGVLNWTPLAGDDAKTFGFTVQVEDQDGNITSVTWTGTIELSHFIFYDSTDVGSLETGAIADPYNDWHSAFGVDTTDTKNNNKLCYFRAGDHPLTGYVGNNNNYQILGSNKCRAYMNYPDESPAVGLNTGSIVCTGAPGLDDLWFQGINWHDNNPAANVGRMIVFFSSGDRHVFWRDTFTNYNLGVLSGGNNPAIVYMNGADKQYVVFSDNIATGTVKSFFHFYQITDGVIEGNRLVAAAQNEFDGSSPGLFYLKDDPVRVSVRANDLYDVTFTMLTNEEAASYVIGVNGQDGFSDVELCYNKVRKVAADGGKAISVHDNTNASYLAYGHVYYYRNSIEGEMHHLTGSAPETGYIGKNIMTDTIDPLLSGAIDKESGIAVSATTNTITLDSGTARTRGLVSWRIEITSGTGMGQIRRITEYDNATKLCTVDSNWTVTPDNTSGFRVFALYTDDNNEESQAAAFDANMDLTGPARSNFLGTHGAEIT